MLKLNAILRNLSRRHLPIVVCRDFSAKTDEQLTKISSRQKTWLETQERYKNYQNVIYSSFLETQEEHMSYGLKRSLVNKIKRDRRRLQNEAKLNSLSTGSEIPNDWMEEYEHYSGPVDENGNDEVKNKMGTADATIPSSNVPCNGCGAHLHCNHHTRPGKFSNPM